MHGFFEAGIYIKFLNSIWELTSGLLILFSSKATLNKIFNFLSNKELLEDPHDFLFNYLSGFLQNLTHGIQIFIAAYILIHGLLNLFLAIELMRDKIWAYAATIFVMSILILYQIHRIIIHHSLILTIITVFDALFIMLTWHEYNRKKSAGVV